MDAEINDSPSALQQYLGFTTTLKRFEPCHTSAFRSIKYNCSYHSNHINISSRAANTHLIKTLYNGKSRPSSRARSYILNTMFLFLWLIIQLLKTVKSAHKILSLTYLQKMSR